MDGDRHDGAAVPALCCTWYVEFFIASDFFVNWVDWLITNDTASKKQNFDSFGFLR